MSIPVDDHEAFSLFLDTFGKLSNPGGPKYEVAISDMAVKRGKSLVLDFSDLYDFDERLATNILFDPEHYLEDFSSIAFSKLLMRDPSHAKSIKKMRLRIRGLPDTTMLRMLGAEHIGHLISLTGIVLRASVMRPFIIRAVFTCESCHEDIYVAQLSPILKTPKRCSGCQSRRGFDLNVKESEWINSQVITIQERPEELPPGQTPRRVDILLLEDLVNVVNPGDIVRLTGTIVLHLRAKRTGAQRDFDVTLHGNFIEANPQGLEIVEITPEDVKQILELSKDPQLRDKMIRSIAPSCYGYEPIKEAILMLLFGGERKILPDVTIRGDIHILLCGDPGTYKALDKDTPIPTPDGWKTMEEIQVGDRAFDEMGTPCNVTHVTPLMFGNKVYDITFDDGSTIRADEGHLWFTSSRASRVSRQRFEKRNKIRSGGPNQEHKRILDSVKTTLDLKNTLNVGEGRRNHAITNAKPLNLPGKPIPIPPYTLGAWLGDGNSQNGGITCVEKEILENIEKDGFTVRKRKSREDGYGILGLQRKLRLNNLVNNKHIPSDYLRASLKQRLELLQGLMDTDGGQLENASATFGNTKKELALGFSELLYSLGIKHRINEYDAVVNGKYCGPYYVFCFVSSLPLFKLKRKLEKQNMNVRKTTKMRYITDVEEVQPTPVKCIVVDSESHLYLAGKAMIPTHNSQFLVYAARTAPRAVETTGRGSTAAGLTSAVVKDKDGRLSLEAGALVLADDGVCCIDEMDKMRDEDRGAIHPVMEQQVVHVAKGGIIAQLNARASILAAANPTLGRWDPYKTIVGNLSKFPIPLLTRFDLIFIVRDIPNQEIDGMIADRVLALHEGAELPYIPVEPGLLRKYIAFSKGVHPRITGSSKKRLKEYYLKMRSNFGEGATAAVSITARQLESLVRLAEANARMHLREEVTDEDSMFAVALMQKSLEEVSVDPETEQVDIDIIYSGKPRSMQVKLQKTLSTINGMVIAFDVAEDDTVFKALLEDHGINRLEAAKLIGVLMRDGAIYEPRPGYYKSTSSPTKPKKPKTEKSKNLQEELDRVYNLVFSWKDGLATEKVASELGIDRKEALKLLNILFQDALLFHPDEKASWWKA